MKHITTFQNFLNESISEGKTIGSLSDEDDAIYVEAKDLLAGGRRHDNDDRCFD